MTKLAFLSVITKSIIRWSELRQMNQGIFGVVKTDTTAKGLFV